jgi:hypothetical protein
MNDTKDIKNTIRNYLSEHGYPLEMFVAKEFRKAGFEVYQSSMYIDQETGKNRELDVIAYYPRVLGEIHFNFKVIIECKYAKNPWILFSGENKGFEDLKIDSFYCCNYAGSEMLNRLTLEDNFNEKTWFKLNLKLGYGLTEAIYSTREKEKVQTTYKAITTLINSLKHERAKDNAYTQKTFDVFVPVIVMQGKLFECYLNESNEVEVNEINEGQLLYKSNVYPNVFPSIEIINKDQVFILAEKLRKDFEAIVKDYQDELEALFKNYPINPDHLHLSDSNPL